MAGAASTREVASYLLALRPIVSDALRARHTWLLQLTHLMDSARHGNGAVVAQSAGRVGREHVEPFRDARARAGRLRAPQDCAGCQEAIQNWLDRLVSVCEVLVAVGAAGDLRRMHETQDQLAEARGFARRFNAEYQRLVTDLRARVRVAERERAQRARQRERRLAPPARPVRRAG